MTTKPLNPNQIIGIIGGGQLGRMLAGAATELGFRTHIYADRDNAPATQSCTASTIGTYDDAARLAQFAAEVDCLTYEFENIPAAALKKLQSKLLPNASVLDISQDRLTEKNFLRELGLRTADFYPVNEEGDITDALVATGGEGILKTRRFGYDGKGQWHITAESDLAAIAEEWDRQPAIMESVVPFEREISVVAARGAQGESVFYDPIENIHQNHILHESRCPADINEAQAAQARAIAETLLTALNYVGVLTIEIFVGREGLRVNEIAPRVHNSGHLTSDACACGQFEQHIRAIAGWPLGDATRHSDARMINLLGDEVKHWEKWAGQKNTRLHLYGKAQARVGRKMGHVTELIQPVSR